MISTSSVPTLTLAVEKIAEFPASIRQDQLQVLQCLSEMLGVFCSHFGTESGWFKILIYINL